MTNNCDEVLDLIEAVVLRCSVKKGVPVNFAKFLRTPPGDCF